MKNKTKLKQQLKKELTAEFHWNFTCKIKKKCRFTQKESTRKRGCTERDGCLFQRSASDWRVHCTSLRGRGRRVAVSLTPTGRWVVRARGARSTFCGTWISINIARRTLLVLEIFRLFYFDLDFFWIFEFILGFENMIYIDLDRFKGNIPKDFDLSWSWRSCKLILCF